MDPRPGFQQIVDAYAIGQGALESSIAPCDDVFYGVDPDGVRRPFAVVRGRRIGFRGTILPSEDHLTEWATNFDIVPVETAWGFVARGVYRVFQSLKTRSGKPLAAYAGCPVDGHSQGAGLAALVAILLRGTPTLWACPNWFCARFGERFAALNGAVYAMAGDIVPLSPLPIAGINPRLGPLTHLVPTGSGDLLYHHAFSTYMASFEAQFPAQQAA